jgi:hypothetical protein
MSIHTSRRGLAGILIAIASPENPVYAITSPATMVGTPPKERLSMLANPISI